MENLLAAWREFRRGKRKKLDVQKFEYTLEENLFEIHTVLKEKKYAHGLYQSFFVCDPKLRHIHKASVRDRVIHQAVFRMLEPIFDTRFIHDSYSCRAKKGTHRGVRRLAAFVRKISFNNTQPASALKCDIKKFFEHIDHNILLGLLKKNIVDGDTIWLLRGIIESYEVVPGVGLPLGNVTSQLFANVYLNELDQFVKHTLKEKYYIRYCDDFIILSYTCDDLQGLVPKIQNFLKGVLRLSLHPSKVVVRKVSQGIDFLGYVVLPYRIAVRTKTRKRMFRKLKQLTRARVLGSVSENELVQSIQSYLGILTHADALHLRNRVLAMVQGCRERRST